MTTLRNPSSGPALWICTLALALLALPACDTAIDAGDPVGNPPPDVTDPTDPTDPTERPEPPTDPDALPAPQRVGLIKQPGFAKYALQWTLPESDDEIGSVVVYASDQPIDETDDALILAELDPAASRFDVEIQPNSGEHHFRVVSLATDGRMSPLSAPFTADSATRLTFAATKNRADTTEMFATSPGDSEPVCISGDIKPFSVAGLTVMSPDGRRVAFASDRDRLGGVSLYVNDLSGKNQPVLVSELNDVGDVILSIFWTVDARQLIYTTFSPEMRITRTFRAEASGAGEPVEMAKSISATSLAVLAEYSASRHEALLIELDPTGNTTVALHIIDVATNAHRELIRFDSDAEPTMTPALSPDGRSIAFTADLSTPWLVELFVMPTDGSADPLAISGAIVPDGGVNHATWSPDGSMIGMQATKDHADIDELYVVPADGSAEPVLMSGARPKSWGVNTHEFSPDGKMIAFIADKEVSTRNELFVATVATGGEPAKVSGNPVGRGIRGFEWSPRSNQLSFLAEIDSTNIYNVYSTRTDGVGQPQLENGSLVPDGSVSVIDFNYSSDGVFLSFHADKEVKGVYDRYLVRVRSGVDPVSATGDLAMGGGAIYGTGVWTSLGR